MNTPFQPPLASFSWLLKFRFFSIRALFVNLKRNKWDFKETYYDKSAYPNRHAKYTPFTAVWLIYYGYKVLLAHMTHQKCYMALLRNIDCRGIYTSSSFIIDDFVQGELFIFVECKAKCGVFIPLQCGWFRCFSVHSAAEAQGASIGCY